MLSATDLKLGGNFVSDDVVVPGTMVQSGNSITVTLGTRTSGTVLDRRELDHDAGARRRLAKDLAGKASATTTVTETSDQDF